MLFAISLLLVFVAFLLLLLVSLSVPIIKTIYLFRLIANASSSLLHSSAAGNVRFGVWGYCVSAIDVSIVGIDHGTNAQCSPAKLGYTFDQTVASVLHVDGLENAISHALTAVLVLHPIACAFAFLALITSFFMFRRRSIANVSRSASACMLGAVLFAALLTTVIFLLDIILVAVVRQKISKDFGNKVILHWGNAVWLILGSAVALWGALVGACAGVYGLRRSSKASRY